MAITPPTVTLAYTGTDPRATTDLSLNTMINGAFADLVTQLGTAAEEDAANLLNRANHLGTQSQSSVSGLVDALADGLDRANHLGTQAQSTVAGLERDLAARVVQFKVPSFRAALNITLNDAGSVVDAQTRHDVRVVNRLVPRFRGAIELVINANGTPVGALYQAENPNAAFPVGDQVAAVGGVEVRAAAGSITGRSVEQLFLRRSEGVFVPLTGGPSPVKLLDADEVGGMATISRGGVVQSLKWRATPVSTGDVLHLVLVMGQSLAQGHQDSGVADAIPLWRDLVAERAWQFQAGDGIQRGPRVAQYRPVGSNKAIVLDAAQIDRIEPLRGARHANDAQYAQTACETAALALLGQHLHRNDHVLCAVIGTGSTAIADFGPASQHYANAQAVIASAADVAAALSLNLRVWLVWNQGEEDNSVGTAQAAYQSAWLAIRNGLSAYAVSEGGTFGGTVIQQTLQRPSGATGMATLAHAALIEAGEALGVPAIAMGASPYSGSTHLLSETYLPLGSATGYEISRMIAGGTPRTPHVGAGGAVLTTGTQIDCIISGGTGAFVFDDTLPADATRGIRVVNSGGAVPISAVALTGENTLRITLGASILIGTAPKVQFGLHGATANQSRVSIRDTSGWPCPVTGRIVSGWMMHHEVSVA